MVWTIVANLTKKVYWKNRTVLSLVKRKARVYTVRLGHIHKYFRSHMTGLNALRRSRRISKDSLSRRIIRLVPVFRELTKRRRQLERL